MRQPLTEIPASRSVAHTGEDRRTCRGPTGYLMRITLASWRASPSSKSGSRSSTTWPTAGWPCRCSSRCGCSGRCSSRVKPGVGKTALAAAMAAALDTDLIRLQCYEGLDITHAVYEWDYARQLLELRILEAAGGVDRASARRELYSDAFLIKRPLLQAIDPSRTRPAVLLIDEIDRADEEFEGYLLELLAEFQITIPELGTVRATHPPLVILTSNRTREVHDALKRRCLYQWIDYPGFDKELAIVRQRVPQASARLAAQVTAVVQELRARSSTSCLACRRRWTGWRRSWRSIARRSISSRAEETLGVAAQGQRRHRRRPRREARRADRPHMTCAASILENLLDFGRLLRATASTSTRDACSTSRGAPARRSRRARRGVPRCRTLLVHRHEDFATSIAPSEFFWTRNEAAVALVRAERIGARDRLTISRRASVPSAGRCEPGATPTRWRPRISRSSRPRRSRSPAGARAARWNRRTSDAPLDSRARAAHRSPARACAQPSHRRRVCVAAAPAAAASAAADRAARATSAGRWSATRACCSTSRTRWRATPGVVEAFLFSTRLTRITMELRTPRPDAAVAAVSRAVPDWSGGTRIGEALRTFTRWRPPRRSTAGPWCC